MLPLTAKLLHMGRVFRSRKFFTLLASSILLILWLSALPPGWSQSVVAVSMELSPTEATMMQGASQTQLATVKLKLLFYVGTEPLTVTLSSSGQPSGVDIQFDPNPIDISSGTVTSVMTATTSITTPTGDYPLTVTATLSNGAQDSKQFVLKIVARSCVIATAAFGSELSEPVQFLRTFRDQVVLGTFAGSEFLKAFNVWYYSFSPSVAAFISGSSTLRALARVLIYPLIGFLEVASSVYSVLRSLNPEVGVVGSGLIASALIGATYLGLPLTLIFSLVRRKIALPFRSRHLRVPGFALIVELCAILLAEITRSGWLMMIGSAVFVLTVILSAGLTVSIFLLNTHSRDRSFT